MSTPTMSPSPDFNEAPWTEFPAFTKERLEVVGAALREARRKAVERYEPDEGENAWSLGCTAYVRQRKAIRDLAKTNDWLGLLQEISSLAFSFSIGQHAVRYFAGDAEDAKGNHLCRSFGELQHVQFLMQFVKDVADVQYMFRIAVATDEFGYASDIYLVKMDNEGNILGSYLIPKKEESKVVSMQSKPVTMPPAAAIPLKDETKEKESSSENLGDGNKNVG